MNGKTSILPAPRKFPWRMYVKGIRAVNRKGVVVNCTHEEEDGRSSAWRTDR